MKLRTLESQISIREPTLRTIFYFLLVAATLFAATAEADTNSPLLIASESGRIDLVRSLLATKADVNIKAANGGVPRQHL
jgi:hypothetical protein